MGGGIGRAAEEEGVDVGGCLEGGEEGEDGGREPAI